MDFNPYFYGGIVSVIKNTSVFFRKRIIGEKDAQMGEGENRQYEDR